MAGLIIAAAVGLAFAIIALKVSGWRKSYVAAKSTGFPTFISPVHLKDIWWLATYRFLVPILSRLPPRWRSPWLPMAQVWNIWKAGYQPFQDAGSDTFVLATPRGSILWTCDPAMINQLTVQHPKSQVDVEMVKFFQVYGSNVGSVEGEEWKRHRKVVMSGFQPSTSASVFAEAKQQAEGLIYRWAAQEQGNTVRIMKQWTSRLSLHVISAVFFGKRLTWGPEEESPPSGHRMSYEQAMFTIIRHIGILFITPKVLLGRLPVKAVREAHTAFTDFTGYMRELIGDTTARAPEIAQKKNKSILESIVLAGTTGSAKTGGQPLAEDSILGNLFFTLMAGHETPGNTMAFALYLLAIFPEYQAKIQTDLDKQLAERPLSEWTAETDFQPLQKGWLGAVLKEVLRLYCPIQFIPRITAVPMIVTDSSGITHTIPERTTCLLNFAGAFRNPNTWPQRAVSQERRDELHHSPAIDFDPSQWLGNGSFVEEQEDSTPRLFPFGIGPHACPGRLFAQTEMTAVLATILADYKLELVVDDALLQSCSGNFEAAMEKTRDRAIRTLIDGVETNITIQLLIELPVQLVKRNRKNRI